MSKQCGVRGARCLAFGAVVAMLGAMAAATPSVTIDSVRSRWPWNGKMDVKYTVAGGGDSCGLELSFTAQGQATFVTNLDASAMTEGAHTFVFCADRVWGQVKTDAAVTAVVTDYLSDAVGVPLGAVSAMGDVMVIDVGGGPEATSYPVRCFSNVDMGIFNCDTYKTTKIVMRKVAKNNVYTVGDESTGQWPHWPVRNPTVNADYYIGLFPITQRQYFQVMGGDAPAQGTETAPKGSVSYNMIRSNQNEENVGARAAVSGDGFMHVLCQKAGAGLEFDLPTEVQWEIAARAGKTGEYGWYLKDGAPIAGSYSNICEFAWCDAKDDLPDARPVGEKLPNVWGLYDTAGNVWELCRDEWNGEGAAYPELEPGTPYDSGGSTGNRMGRGGRSGSDATFCRPSYRYNCFANFGDTNIGFRVSCTSAPLGKGRPRP